MAPFACDLQGSWPSFGVTALFAPSGAGKTTLLRFFAGLVNPGKHDFLTFNGDDWARLGHVVPLHRRNIACVFQHHALLSHLTVEKNIAFAQRFHKNKLSQADLREIFEIMDVLPLLKKMPSHLSGGERQRAVIALALLQSPRWLLLDEPMTGIDYKHKKIILKFIKNFCIKHKIPIFMISHQMEDMIDIADHLVLMEKGHFIAEGTFLDVVNKFQPFERASEGAYQLFEMVVCHENEGVFRLKDNAFTLDIVSCYLAVGECVRIKVAARDVSLSLKPQESSMLNTLAATISSIKVDESEGYTLVTLVVESHIIFSEISTFSYKRLKLAVGMQVFAQIKATALRL